MMFLRVLSVVALFLISCGTVGLGAQEYGVFMRVGDVEGALCGRGSQRAEETAAEDGVDSSGCL